MEVTTYEKQVGHCVGQLIRGISDRLGETPVDQLPDSLDGLGSLLWQLKIRTADALYEKNKNPQFFAILCDAVYRLDTRNAFN